MFLDGEQLVDQVFGMNELERLAGFLADRIGVHVEVGKSDRSAVDQACKQHKQKSVYGPLIPMLRRTPPPSVIRVLRKSAMSRIDQNAARCFSAVIEAGGRLAFLKNYYAPDFELLERARSAPTGVEDVPRAAS
ncbi:hypothetical protein [Rhodovulum sp. ES.010]|uniref:hypothetical protein n=1 Tax=Rhodovulum sp. ES.010 TaxID=1882821 RepID=UPI0009F8C846|nr:hypothetical protein [Rhodovulum sp. ES.010]